MDNLGHLDSIFARNCTVRRIDKTAAAVFLDEHHRFGDASCRYRYGLFVQRSTGASEISISPGSLVAVATFSNARKMHDGSRSYEWVRYASAKGCRVVGGMGKLLDAFISEISPDDVMTYSDTGWSNGDVYKELGFKDEGIVKRPGYSNRKWRLRLSQPDCIHTLGKGRT